MAAPSQQEFEKHLIPPQEVMRRLAISESGFVFDPVSGHSFTVNETGRFLLHHIQQGHKLDGILEDVQTHYTVANRDAERDIMEFLSSLKEYLGA